MAEADIHGIVVKRQTANILWLEVEYSWDGSGPPVYVGAITVTNGKSDGNWAYRPARLQPGMHRALVRITSNSRIMQPWCSNEVEVYFYRAGGHAFRRTRFPLNRCWYPGQR